MFSLCFQTSKKHHTPFFLNYRNQIETTVSLFNLFDNNKKILGEGFFPILRCRLPSRTGGVQTCAHTHGWLRPGLTRSTKAHLICFTLEASRLSLLIITEHRDREKKKKKKSQPPPTFPETVPLRPCLFAQGEDRK